MGKGLARLKLVAQPGIASFPVVRYSVGALPDNTHSSDRRGNYHRYLARFITDTACHSAFHPSTPRVLTACVTGDMEDTMTEHKATLGYSKSAGLELVVPAGTKLADLGKVLQQIDVSAVARLPRGCNACISGHPFNIREAYEAVINVEMR
jgi:hypothetical protein